MLVLARALLQSDETVPRGKTTFASNITIALFRSDSSTTSFIPCTRRGQVCFFIKLANSV